MAAPGKKEGRTTRLRSQIVGELELCQGEYQIICMLNFANSGWILNSFGTYIAST